MREIGSSIHSKPQAEPMKTALTLINVLAFAALFAVHVAGNPAERPSGVRRAMQIYAGQLPTGSYPTLKPVWELGVETADLA